MKLFGCERKAGDSLLFDKEYVKPSKKTSPDNSQYQKYYGKKYGRWVNPHWVNSNYTCSCSVCGGEAWAPYKHPFQWNCRVLPDMR